MDVQLTVVVDETSFLNLLMKKLARLRVPAPIPPTSRLRPCTTEVISFKVCGCLALICLVRLDQPRAIRGQCSARFTYVIRGWSWEAMAKFHGSRAALSAFQAAPRKTIIADSSIQAIKPIAAASPPNTSP